MISASAVYWVMQADTLKFILGVLGFLTMVGGLSAIFFSVLEANKSAGGMGRNLLFASLACMLLIAFVPSSKTLSAMILLPSITSDKVIDVVTPEAKELYDLAKEALKNLSHPKECRKEE